MSDDPARARFMAIHAMRWAGVALVILAALIIARRIDLPVEIGYVLFVVGVFDAFFMPVVLARRWRTPRP
jgi:hypothetical protein